MRIISATSRSKPRWKSSPFCIKQSHALCTLVGAMRTTYSWVTAGKYGQRVWPWSVTQGDSEAQRKKCECDQSQKNKRRKAAPVSLSALVYNRHMRRWVTVINYTPISYRCGAVQWWALCRVRVRLHKATFSQRCLHNDVLHRLEEFSKLRCFVGRTREVRVESVVVLTVRSTLEEQRSNEDRHGFISVLASVGRIVISEQCWLELWVEQI